MRAEAKEKIKNSNFQYEKFSLLDGSHPFKKAVPDGFIEYKARVRHGGAIRYFNFELAREMGLISKDHKDELNQDLSKVILDTFSIIIINEYDLLHHKKFKDSEIKPGSYMATRYLQLQHPDKVGKNSGDGRGVWNGQIKNKGKIWDISSSGTGATRLSPACTKFNKFFESGDPTISYGCGYSEIDEGFSTLVFSEIFNKNKIKTERILALIEFENGYSISVRSHENLLRPSHFFLYLKQNNLESLKNILDYHIEILNKKSTLTQDKYKNFLDDFARKFAKMAATFEDEYIFCWLDWDGDNILMDGGIIDYGSIRQFGLFHYEYRYDDVERYSTNIVEQKNKARYIVQTFCQAVDYILTGKKKQIGSFRNAKELKLFDKIFKEEKRRNLLQKIGFSDVEQAYLLQHKSLFIERLFKNFSYFERAKSKKGKIEISDGVTWDAIFCMRDLLRELPQIYLSKASEISEESFINILKSSYATKADLYLNSYRKKMIHEFQKNYLKLVTCVSKYFSKDLQSVLLSVSMRSSIFNKYDRVTGDSITYISDKLVSLRSKFSASEVYALILDFSLTQKMDYDLDKVIRSLPKKEKIVLSEFFEIVKECREGI